MIKELFSNNKNELSTTATTQMLSVIALVVGFIIALVLDKPAAAEIGFMLTALAGWTGSSKGFIDYKNKTIKGDNKHE